MTSPPAVDDKEGRELPGGGTTIVVASTGPSPFGECARGWPALYAITSGVFPEGTTAVAIGSWGPTGPNGGGASTDSTIGSSFGLGTSLEISILAE